MDIKALLERINSSGNLRSLRTWANNNEHLFEQVSQETNGIQVLKQKIKSADNLTSLITWINSHGDLFWQKFNWTRPEGIKPNFNLQTLLDNGWVKSDGVVFLLEKAIENKNPTNNDPEHTDIKLVYHRLDNSGMFAVLFPNGAMLNFKADTIEELNSFEKQILYYDCEY